MAWVRVDDKFPDHPKVVQAGPLAGWLHVAALCYCNRNMTDGFVPFGAVSRLADWDGVAVLTGPNTGDDVDVDDLVRRLVDLGMWDDVVGGFRIHDYLDYQPSAADLKQRSQAKAAAGRKGGLVAQARKRRSTEANQAESEQPPSRVEADRQANGQAKSKPVPVPNPITELVVSPTGRDAAEPDDDGLLMAVAKARGARLGRSHPTWLDAVVVDLDANRARQLANRGLTPAEIDVELDQRRTDPPAQPDEPERSGRLPEASEVVTHVPDELVADAHAGAAAAREALRRGPDAA